MNYSTALAIVTIRFVCTLILLLTIQVWTVGLVYANPINNDRSELELQSNSRYELLELSKTFFDTEAHAIESIKPDQLDSFMQSLNAADISYSSGVYWLKIDTYNKSNSEQWTLHVNDNRLRRFDVLILTDNQQINLTSNTESQEGVAEFNAQGRALSFELLTNSKQTLLIRLELDYIDTVPAVSLMPAADYKQWSKILDLVFVALIGALVAVTLYSISLFILVRDWSHLWFSMLGICAIVGMLQYSGLYWLLISTSDPDHAISFFAFSWINVFMVCFCRSSLESKKNLPRLDNVLVVLLIMSLLIIMVIPFVSVVFPLTSIWIIRIFITIAAIIASCLRLFQGLRLAGFLLAGWLLLFGAETLWNIEIIFPQLNSWFSYPDILTYSAATIQLFLFSLALSERVNELEREKFMAQRANLEKSQFLASASHDLRQPLHAIGLFIDAIGNEINSHKGLLMLAKVQRSLGNMSLLFDSILDISRLEASAVKVQKSRLSLSSLFSQLDEEFSPLAREKGLQLNCINSSLMVDTDPQLLERVLRNLLSNAIRYTPQGKVIIGCRRDKQNVRIEVWDSGIGINQEDQQRIFDEYRQINTNTGDTVKGLGLGLAIVKRSVSLLDIDLQLRSWVGKGSVFSLTLPVAKNPEPQTEPNPEKQIVTKINFDLWVIVIDDDNAILEAMEVVLSQWGCRVILANNIDGAFDKINQQAIKPDVLFADIQLSETETGLVAIKLFQQRWGNNISCVLITGDTHSKNLQEAQHLGITVFHKPLRPVSLRRFLTQITQQH